MANRKTVWEVHNGLLKNMRQQGHTLQAIGDKVGVTRERIRQILNKKYGKVYILPWTETQVAKIIGCSNSQLIKLRNRNIIKPTRYRWFWLYDRDIIEKVYLVLQKRCLHCGEFLPIKNQRKYCLKCKQDRHRNAYPFKTKEQKRKHLDSTILWKKNHPEQAKEIQRRADKRYQERKKQGKP